MHVHLLVLYRLAYVGRSCNFRQKVTEFLARLRVMSADMPLVQVRPRKYKEHSPGKPLFKVDVHKLKLASDWLKQHNPYYYHVEWCEDAAAAWEAVCVSSSGCRGCKVRSGHVTPGIL